MPAALDDPPERETSSSPSRGPSTSYPGGAGATPTTGSCDVVVVTLPAGVLAEWIALNTRLVGVGTSSRKNIPLSTSSSNRSSRKAIASVRFDPVVGPSANSKVTLV